MNRKADKMDISIYSWDCENLADFKPDDPSDFQLSIEISITYEKDNAEDIFSVFACTPKSISRYYASYFAHEESENSIFGDHMLIMKFYDYKKMIEKLHSFIDESIVKDHKMSVLLLKRNFYSPDYDDSIETFRYLTSS